MRYAILHDKRFIWIDTRLRADVFDATLPVLSEHVEPEAVCVAIDYAEKVSFELLESRRVDDAFEDGVLDALTELAALLRNFAEPPSAFPIFGGHVVTHQYHHGTVTVA